MNAIGHMHKAIFLNVYLLLSRTDYILPLTVLIGLGINARTFSKVRQSLSCKFAMDYGDIKD